MSLFALCLGFFMIIIDVIIVAVALPNIASDLGGAMSGLQWVVDGYALTFTCLLLSSGALADRFGAKSAFITGLALFTLTSLGCGYAPSITLLIFFRLLQGVAAAFIVPTSVALINASYEDTKERAKAIGVWAMVGATAAGLSPILGAFITSGFGWRGVFLVNIPVGILAIVLTLKYVINPKSKQQSSFDFSGQVIAIIMLATLAAGLIEAGRIGWLAPMVLIYFIICALSFILFVVIENHVAHPMLPLSFFKNKIFSSIMLIGCIMNIGCYGVFFIVPLYFQQIRGYTVLMSGLGMMPLVILNVLASYISSKLTVRYGIKLPIIIGLALGAMGLFMMLMTKAHSPDYWALVFPLFAIGFGTVLIMPAATIAIINSVPSERAGIASGTFNTARQLGSLLGVAIFGTMIGAAHNFIAGMHISLVIAGIAFIIGVFLVFFSIASHRRELNESC